MAIDVQREAPAMAQMLGNERLEVFLEQVARGWKRDPTAAEVEQMALYYQAARYNPWARPPQMVFTLRWDSSLSKNVMTPQKTLDGYRLDAYRSHDIATMIGPEWCADDGVWRDVWLRSEAPRAARYGIQKRGATQPQWSVALWDEWVQKDRSGEVASFWLSKPAHMLGKTAEIMALKRALPNETDPLAIEHQREMERLAVGPHADAYTRAFGTEEQSAYDIPRFVPLSSRTDVLDAPRPAPALAAPVATAAPQAPRQQRPLGELYAQYGALLTQARHAGVIPEGEVARWMLPRGAARELVIERGTALRKALERASQDDDGQHDGLPDDGSGDELEISRAASEGEGAPTLFVSSIDDPEYQRLVSAIERAAQLDIDFDDCRVVLDPAQPVAVLDVVRKRQELEMRIQANEQSMQQR